MNDNLKLLFLFFITIVFFYYAKAFFYNYVKVFFYNYIKVFFNNYIKVFFNKLFSIIVNLKSNLVIPKSYNKKLKIATKEIERFILIIKGMDSKEIGSVLALTFDLKNKMLKDGINLLDPIITLSAYPNLLILLEDKAIKLQKENNTVFASGILIWVHTYRGVLFPELRYKSKEMWAELERGFYYTKIHSLDFLDIQLDLTDPSIPIGFDKNK